MNITQFLYSKYAIRHIFYYAVGLNEKMWTTNEMIYKFVKLHNYNMENILLFRKDGQTVGNWEYSQQIFDWRTS